MNGAVRLSPAALAALMPLHVAVGPDGRIGAVGPTLARLRPDEALAGRPLFDVFAFRRPRAPRVLAQLIAEAGRPLSLQFRAAPRTVFKGLLVPLPAPSRGGAGQGALINLSFGIGAVAAVGEYRLSSADFAPTDLTVEMLYLVEAKSAAMEESRRLNRRLDGARSAAEEQALTDPLTGLGNRRAMEDGLARLTRARVGFGLIHLDLDRFKAVNDTLGHAAGDAVLVAVARALRAEIRDCDLAARVGGDEFVVLLPEAAEGGGLLAIARRIIARIEQPIPYGDRLCRVSGSAGVTLSAAYARPDPARMLQDADAALYASKHAGRGCATLWQAEPAPAAR